MQYLSPFPGFRKTLILERREAELRHAIQCNLTPEKIQRAAERVRTAHLHLFKALRHELAPCDEANEASFIRMQKLSQASEDWEHKPVEAIIQIYRDNQT